MIGRIKDFSIDIPLLFGRYSNAALAQGVMRATYDANACWFYMFDESAVAHIQGNAAGAMLGEEASL
jgi:hypothetical protein